MLVVPEPGGNSHVKGLGILVVSHRVANYSFWYPLGVGIFSAIKGRGAQNKALSGTLCQGESSS